MAFNNRNEDDNTNEYYTTIPKYKSYDEIVAEKKRKGRIRRAITLATCLIVVSGVGIIVVSDKDGFNQSGDLREYSASGNTQDDSATDEKFSMENTKKPAGTGAVVVKDVRDVVAKVKPSVVGVVTESFADYATGSTGSGIILSSDGYIVTNNHVIEDGNNISVTLDSGESYSAYVIGKDAKTDIAVLKIEAENLPEAEFGDSDELVAGEAAIAIGNPMGLELQGTVTAGVISAVNRNIMVGNSRMNLIQTDASINPGNSGGALINEFGQVVGVNSVKIRMENYEGLGFAIPSNTVKPIVEELIANGYVSGRPLVGISARVISPMAAAFYGLPQGLMVDSIEPSSSAAEKGLLKSDIIIGVAGVRVSSIAEACTLRDEHKAGDKLKLTIYRQGEKMEIDITLMEEARLGDSYNF